MRFNPFQYGLPLQGNFDDMNDFIAAHKVVGVTQNLVQTSSGALLVFVVETAMPRGDVASVSSQAKAIPSDTRLDYQEILSPEDFAVFSRLRDLRKVCADRIGKPVFSVFNNAQLAEMVEKRITTAEGLQAIPGVGLGKTNQWGPEFLALLSQEWSEPVQK